MDGSKLRGETESIEVEMICMGVCKDPCPHCGVEVVAPNGMAPDTREQTVICPECGRSFEL